MSAADLYLRDDLAAHWSEKNPFEEIEALSTEPVRAVARRRTFRFELGGAGYYAKVHQGVGWPEILKNWLVGKRPVLDASNEFQAAMRLQDAGLDTLGVAGFGVRGRNPAQRESFLVTDEIVGTQTLESHTLTWPDKAPPPGVKWALIRKVADVARTMHAAGVNHRDFYICHLLLAQPHALTSDEDNLRLYLVDLHRAQIRNRVPRRWLIRDLGGLYYSTLDIGLTRRDRLRFLARYFRRPLRELLAVHGPLLRAVERRASKLYAKAQRKGILPRQLAQQGR